jgi:membrane protease YdiL (CAAX protease family)
MQTLRAFVARHPVAVFFVLAYAWTWPLAALISVSLLLPVLGLFGPAVAALAVTAATEGRAGVRGLLLRLTLWRVRPAWYAVAVGLPLALTLASIALNVAMGTPTAPAVGDFSAISLALAVLIVGEEIGWRGFALPRLMETRSPLAASLIVGVLWAFWHLPNFLIAGYPHHGRSLAYFVAAVVAYSVLAGWIFVHTRGSVPLASLFHAAVNLFTPTDIASPRQDWLEALVYGAAALAVVAVLGPGLARAAAAEPAIAPSARPV